MHKVIAFAFLLSLAGFAGTASAATAEEQQACQDDAFKFCNDAIPDEEKVKACLIHNMRHLTPACRSMFGRGRSRRK
jgi:Cysteine rich repeat